MKKMRVCYYLNIRTHKRSSRVMSMGRSLSWKTVREGSWSISCEQDIKVPEELQFEGEELKPSQKWSPPGKDPGKR